MTEIEQKPAEPTKQHEELPEAPAEAVEAAKQKAVAFLEQYFATMCDDYQIDTCYEDKTLHINVSSSHAGIVIGNHGETMEALQLLVSTIVNRKQEHFVRVVIDIEGYRKKRVKTLEELAMKVAQTVIHQRRSITLEPMVPFERRVIHTTLQNNPKVKTESIGMEPYRKVVISLKK